MFKYGPKQGKKHNNKDATCPWHRWQGTSRGSVCVSVCVADQLGGPRVEEKQKKL